MARIITKMYNNPNVTQSGEFLVGDTATFFFSFPDSYGDLFDPSNIDIEVLESDQTTSVTTADTVEKLETGTYAWSWDVPDDTTPGTYFLKVTYTAEEEYGPVDYDYLEAFVLTEAETNYLASVPLVYRKYLESLIGVTQRIPVFHETGRKSSDYLIAEFSFPRWNQTSPVKVYINQQLTSIPYTVDYMRGRLNFTNALLPQDEVQASYTFRWFTEEELDQFIEQAVLIFDQYPPVSTYIVGTLPAIFAPTPIMQAAVFALRRLIMDLMFQEPAKVFGGLDRADKIMSSLETLKKNYEEELVKLYEAKKKGPYAGLTRTITPEVYALPGGRCLSISNRLTYQVDNREYVDTVLSCYRLYRMGRSVSVLSDVDGITKFVPVNRIWGSGRKRLLRIVTGHASVDVSEDHVMFVNGLQMPARYVMAGDFLSVEQNGVITNEKITSVLPIGTGLTMDFEVPETQNLIVNGVKTHNSRWARYMFKS